jgi:hypothetical protein
VKLDWENTSLLVGQYWHPMFITEVFPGVVSFNTGVPFQPFSRNPQIRLVNRFNDLFLSITAATQRDFSSTGPNGATSSYLRNAVIPMLDANLKYKSGKTVAGIGINYKSLRPYTELDGYQVDENVSSYSGMAFAKFGTDQMTVKLEGVYGTNLTDLVMLGGYAVKSRGNRGEIEYTSAKTLSGWADISFGKTVIFGLFGGYTMNMGTEDTNNGTYFSRGSNIEYVWRVSPRIQYQIQKVRFAGELEYTTAAYGAPDANGEVQNSSTVENIRVLMAAYLFF